VTAVNRSSRKAAWTEEDPLLTYRADPIPDIGPTNCIKEGPVQCHDRVRVPGQNLLQRDGDERPALRPAIHHVDRAGTLDDLGVDAAATGRLKPLWSTREVDVRAALGRYRGDNPIDILECLLEIPRKSFGPLAGANDVAERPQGRGGTGKTTIEQNVWNAVWLCTRSASEM